jgi:hypothetical protein
MDDCRNFIFLLFCYLPIPQHLNNNYIISGLEIEENIAGSLVEEYLTTYFNFFTDKIARSFSGAKYIGENIAGIVMF